MVSRLLGASVSGDGEWAGRHLLDSLRLEAQPRFEGCRPQLLQLALCITIRFLLSQEHGAPLEPTAPRDRPAPSGTPAPPSILLGLRGGGVRAWSCGFGARQT